MTITEDFLEHYGVQGMKWGVRRADKRWQKNIYSVRGAIAVHNASAEMFNREIGALNARHPKANIDKPDSPATKKYIKEIEAMTARQTKLAVDQVHGVSPSGTLKATLDTSNPAQYAIKVVSTNVQHADDVLPPLIFEVQTVKGLIGSMRFVRDDSVEQSSVVGDFLSHYGVKGMKWGQRRRRGANSKVSKSPEAQKLESTVRKAKKKGVRSLSNKEIADFNKRAELEGKFVKANPSRAAKVEAGAKAVVAMVGLTSSLIGIANTPSGKAAIAAGQKAMSKKTMVTKMATTTVKSLPSDAFIG